ncbi:MAG: FAD-dependent oxidoreductase, partial [Oscillospiraceae bacterium]|nr:FAD-dependent oxidoreductase [Oscillospiraceae bacterium]
MANIIIYGGGFAGVAAAAKAASKAPNHEIILISPYPDDLLGGIGTSGGQNYWDTIQWPKGMPTAQGSFAFWHDTYPNYYGISEMSKLLKTESLGKYSNVSVYTGYDITGFRTVGDPFRITSVDIKKIYRDADGHIRWGVTSLTFDGAVFVDASDEGRLARRVNTAATCGRYDW